MGLVLGKCLLAAAVIISLMFVDSVLMSVEIGVLLDMDVIVSLYCSQSAFLRIHLGLKEVVIHTSFLGRVMVS